MPRPRAPCLGLESGLETEAQPAGFPDPETAGLVARFGRAQGAEVAERKHPGRAQVRSPIKIKAKQVY